MGYNSFFKKVLTYLAELNKGKHLELVKSGFLSDNDANKIELILKKTGCIEELDGIHITRKGLTILLYVKMGKIPDEYDEQVLELLLRAS